MIQILNKKRKLGGERAEFIAQKLKLKSVQRKIFVNLVRLELASNLESQKILRAEVSSLLEKHPQFTLLSEDTFNIVADWYYFAILELTTLKGFKNDPNWISRKLGVSVSEIRIAVDRLKRVGLLVESEESLMKTKKNYLFESQKVPSSAIRKHHQQTLQLASAALEKQPVDKREYFTVSIPMDPKNIDRAKEAIREFSERLMNEMQGPQPKSIYKLAVQMFRLDKESV